MSRRLNLPSDRPLNYLMVVPRFVSKLIVPPMGLAYITAVLRKHGVSISVVNLNLYSEPVGEVLKQVIRDRQVDVLLTGTISAHYNDVRVILESARQIKPDIVTILGGGVISSEPELILDALRPDFGVLGEGEDTIIELARELGSSQNFRDIAGLIFRDSDGQPCRTSSREPIRDLGQLPFPDEELLKPYFGGADGRAHVYDILGSRSCPYKCTFCYHPTGDLYRQRTLDDIFQEIEDSHRKYHPCHYGIIDELFSFRKERVLEFCERIKPYHVTWDVQMRVSDVSPDILRAMREAGCTTISYGLESGSQPVLNSMRKYTKVADLVKAVDQTYEARLQVQGNYIFGDPAETFETAVETFSLWLKQIGKGIYMVPIQVYPGTPLYIDAVKNGKIPDPRTYIEGGCRSINTMNLPDRDALQILRLMYLLAWTYNHAPSRVLDCQPGTCILGKPPQQRFNVKIQCYHCSEEQVYPDQPMHLPQTQKMACGRCGRRFDTPPLSQWRHWPFSFKLAHEYRFDESHAEQMLAFLRQDDGVFGPSERPNMVKTRLFGVRFLIPADVTMDQIRDKQLHIYTLDDAGDQLYPIYIGDGQFSNLHAPKYLAHRVRSLVTDWQAREVSVVLAGTPAELRNLLRWTCIREANVSGILPFTAVGPADQDLGLPFLSSQDIASRSPGVVLIATTRHQREITEMTAATFASLGVEVTSLYETGMHF